MQGTMAMERDEGVLRDRWDCFRHLIFGPYPEQHCVRGTGTVKEAGVGDDMIQ